MFELLIVALGLALWRALAYYLYIEWCRRRLETRFDEWCMRYSHVFAP